MGLQMNRSHGVVSEVHPHRATLSGSGPLTTPGAPRPCWLWLVPGVLGHWGRCCFAHVCSWRGVSEASLPRRVPTCLGCCAPRQAGEGKWQACKVTTSDILRGNPSYFLWITLPFISLQINLVIVGDSPAATAGPFSAASMVCAHGSVFLPCSCAILSLFLVLSSVNTTCYGC